MSAGRVLVVGLVTYFVATLLNASSLQKWADSLQPGATRTAALKTANEARSLSNNLFLDRPGSAIDSARGKDSVPVNVALVPPLPTPIDVAAPVVSTTATTASATTTTTVAVTTTTAASATTTSASATTTSVASTVSSEPLPSTTPVTTTTTVAATAPATIDGMSIWYGGDSLAQGIGESLTQVGAESADVGVRGKGIVSSGLTRPDVHDWAVDLFLELVANSPDVAVLMVGANDTADIATANGLADFGDPAWRDEYRARVARVMDTIKGSKTRLFWLGIPPVRSKTLEAKLRIIDDIAKAEAAGRSDVTFVDLYTVFGGEAGYRPYCAGFDDTEVLCRANDGVHFNRVGYEIVARLLTAQFAATRAI